MGRKSDDYFVESAPAIERRIYLRKRLRDNWRGAGTALPIAELTALAEHLFVSKFFLQTEFDNPQTFGALLEKVQREQTRVGEWKSRYPLVTVEKALSDLRRILEITRREKRKNHQSFSQTSSR